MADKKLTPAATATSEFTSALVEAINITRPEVKKTISTRKRNTPWTPKDGSAKPKLRRKMYQHGVSIDENRITADDVLLLNKLKVGTYGGGLIKVVRRKDQGINIEYSVKTAAQRLKIVNELGIASFTGMLQFLVNEAANPKKLENEEIED